MKLFSAVWVALLHFGALVALADIKVGSVNVTNSDWHYFKYGRHMRVPISAQAGAGWELGDAIEAVDDSNAPGIPAAATAIRLLEVSGSVELEIYNKMVGMPGETFTFANKDEARQTVVMQKFIVNKMNEMNSAGTKFHYHSVTKKAKTNSSYWALGIRIEHLFRQTTGPTYDAVMDLLAVDNYSDCAGAWLACAWGGAATAMGSVAFNTLYPFASSLDMDAPTKHLEDMPDTNTATGDARFVPGDQIYFENYNYGILVDGEAEFKELYTRKWLKAGTIYYWRGENAVYLGAGKFRGLGTVKYTESEMLDKMMDKYNTHLAKVITGIPTLPGGGHVFHNQTVETLTETTRENKIKIRDIRRVKLK